jgi:hypothetical protein
MDDHVLRRTLFKANLEISLSAGNVGRRDGLDLESARTQLHRQFQTIVCDVGNDACQRHSGLEAAQESEGRQRDTYQQLELHPMWALAE